MYISESVSYHLDNNLSLSETIFRYGSTAHLNLINEYRELYNNNFLLNISEDDKHIINTDAGTIGLYGGRKVLLDLPFILDDDYVNEAKYRGREVDLNKPFRLKNKNKKFGVYVKNDKGNVILVKFGDPNMKVKNYDKFRAASFKARHKCHLKKDRTKAGYWACNIGRYRKLLGLSSNSVW